MTNFFSKTIVRIETYLGIGSGYSSASFLGGKTVDAIGKIPSLILNIGDWQLHLHHWLISFGLLLFLLSFLIKRYKLPASLTFFSFGFLAGLILQGIFGYSDWHQILIKNNKL